MNPLGEVENQCTLHDFIVLAIFVPRIIKFGKHVTKLLENNFDSFFSVTRCRGGSCVQSVDCLVKQEM